MPILNTLPFRAPSLRIVYPGRCPGLKAPLGFQPAFAYALLLPRVTNPPPIRETNCSLHSCSLKDPNKSRTFAKRKYTNINSMLPQDPMMLFSAVNMKLRDEYDSLDALCDDMNVDRKHLEDTLAQAGFEYNAEQNKFW